jgi:hypothetical protein
MTGGPSIQVVFMTGFTVSPSIKSKYNHIIIYDNKLIEERLRQRGNNEMKMKCEMSEGDHTCNHKGKDEK